MRHVLSVIYWLFLLASCAVLYPVALLLWLVTAPFDPRRRTQSRFSCWWGSIYTLCNPWWTIEFEGLERLRRDRTCVYVANHQSFLDILLIYRLHIPFKWVSKAENFRVPWIGWNMVLNGDIALKRGDAASIREMVRDCTAELERGNSVMIFPEGTRSADGQLGRFTSGAFKIAQRARVPIVPIVLENSARAMPKSGFLLRGPVRLTVRVLDEVPVAALDGGAKRLAEQVHARYQAELAG